MLSLLPQEQKKLVKREYRMRLTAVACFLIAIVGVLASVALSPYIVISSIKEKVVLERTAALESARQKLDIQDFSEEIAYTKLLIAALAEPSDRVRAETLVERILRAKPDDVSLSGLAIARTSSSTAQVIVDGVAEDRDALLFFVQELKKSPLLKTVVLPVSNFAKAEDIDFSLTMISKY